MSRPALLLLAAAIVCGCRTASDTSSLGSTAESLTSPESKRADPASSSARVLAHNLAPASSPIAVATTNASEAQPCERLCGSLGDCLLADANYTDAAAGGLELACLDLCVHSPDDAPSKAEFLACSRHSECAPLQACAEASWTKLAAARQGPSVAGIEASGDSCKSGCQWLVACLFTDAPPGAAPLDHGFEQYSRDCQAACDEMSPSEREHLIKLPACLANRCSSNDVWLCYDELSR